MNVPRAELQLLCDSDRHSIVLEGPEGCGKTYCAHVFAEMLGNRLENVSFVQVDSTVNSVKSCVDACYNTSGPVVVCIENLDTGSLATSYALLKFLEEPQSNIYVIVTCQQVSMIPDTVVSRSYVLTLPNPRPDDLLDFGDTLDRAKTRKYVKTDVWKCLKTFSDVRNLFSLSDTQISYMQSLSSISFKDPISSIVWKLLHTDGGEELPPVIVLRYLYCTFQEFRMKQFALECLRSLKLKHVATNAIVTKFVLDCKYRSI